MTVVTEGKQFWIDLEEHILSIQFVSAVRKKSLLYLLFFDCTVGRI